MRADDFNEEAMEVKIKNNMVRGLTKAQILTELEKERLQCFQSMRTCEMRAAELSDQIDYMREKHVP
jgi:hypothetical protein